MKKLNFKKTLNYGYIFLIMFFLYSPIVLANDYNNICGNEDILEAMQIIGYVIQVIKWVAPFIIIILGMIDFGKAVISNDEHAVAKATKALIRRVIAGVVIFFVPTIIIAILNYIPAGTISDKNDTQFGACTKCLFDPDNSCK